MVDDDEYSYDEIFKKQCFNKDSFLYVRQNCLQALSKKNIAGFEYARVYNNDTAWFVHSDERVSSYLVKNKIHIAANVPKELISDEFWFIPYSNNMYDNVVVDINNMTGLKSFANYIRRHVGFYEMFCFWMRDDKNIAFNKIINIKEELEYYCNNFYKDNAKFFSSIDKGPFKLSESMITNFKGLSRDSKNRVKFSIFLDRAKQQLFKLNPHIHPHLTVKEIQCLFFLFDGLTASNIASQLDVSVRTIEMHLNSLKLKLKVKRKDEIITRLRDIAESVE